MSTLQIEEMNLSFQRLATSAARLSSEQPASPAYRIAPTIYFKNGGPDCTDLTLEAALLRAEELELKHLLVASTTSFTALKALERCRAHNWLGQLIVVTEHTGYHAPGTQKFPQMDRDFFQSEGVIVITATHAFSGIARSFRLRWQGIDLAETVAESFRRFSRGTKTCLEITVMAADAGVIPVDRDVVAAGGTSRGCDTALVVRPTTMNYFFDLKVREVIALPQMREVEREPIDKGTPQGAAQVIKGYSVRPGSSGADGQP